MAKAKCPEKELEIDVPAECPRECVYLYEGTCVHPLMGREEDGGISIC